ncbi:hypothetical protein [Mucilaginibacter jinjuensis]|uniref:Uncharacterized protein n=1 Tax=Mucilaginibacter jinjuensis TaxID=1176721 RepID=A0ABY7T9S9_9SPHI|nr:hypothetical protein [Mucilaginibacter jinjuensis]WCT13245.1 hypothetical protein PQO05_04785 [Mucilaginibacter jinjuensis]
MTPPDLSQLDPLTTGVARLIKSELATDGVVNAVANQIDISVSHFEVEHRLGSLLQQIYQVADQHFPMRKEHLSLTVRDAGGHYENTFKIWKSAT